MDIRLAGLVSCEVVVVGCDIVTRRRGSLEVQIVMVVNLSRDISGTILAMTLASI